MEKNKFKIAVINTIDISETCFITKHLLKNSFDVNEMPNIKSSYDFINNTKIDLLIINSNNSDEEAKKIIQKFKELNIIFLTNDSSSLLKKEFLKYELLDYKVKFNNLYIITDEIVILINKLMRNKALNILLVENKNSSKNNINTFLQSRSFNVDLINSGTSAWKLLDKKINFEISGKKWFLC